MSITFMTQHQVDGKTILQQVCEDKRAAKDNGSKMGASYWAALREKYDVDSELVRAGLTVRDKTQEVQAPLYKALDQATTSNCTKRSQNSLLTWFQTAESCNQKEFCGLARHLLTLKPASNVVSANKGDLLLFFSVDSRSVFRENRF